MTERRNRRKLKLWVMSDLHIDNVSFELPNTPESTDIIVVAGDVADGHEKSATWLGKNLASLGKPVLFVLGNHEWHGYDLSEDPIMMYEDAGVNVLHWRRPAVVLDDTRFVGATLWTDYNISGDEDAARDWAKREMPDLKDIDLGSGRARTHDLSNRHYRDWKKMVFHVEQGDASATVFITHHAPHARSLCLDRPLQPSDASFASDLTEEIEMYAPDLWVHGHVHRSSDYVQGKTRIVCNPRGAIYRHSGPGPNQNPDFDPCKIIEV